MGVVEERRGGREWDWEGVKWGWGGVDYKAFIRCHQHHCHFI